jgi:hypothetical protein
VYRDVTSPPFGATGNGVTDDTAAINAAIAYDGTVTKVVCYLRQKVPLSISLLAHTLFQHLSVLTTIPNLLER